MGVIAPPAELHYLSDLIGPEATLRLIEAFGGTRLYVPKAPNQGSRLAHAIGLDAARALATAWGRDTMLVPIARAWRVRVYRARGDTYAAIARRLGIREDSVWKILRAAEMTARQTDLFEVGR